MSFGRLQRGLGSGYQWAVGEGRVIAADLVAACVRDDPRCDRQLDDRAEYYARLALELGVQVSPEDDLGIPVLGRMAIKGDLGARGALREHVAEGDGWAEAIEVLSYDYEAGRPAPDWEAAVRGLDEVLVDRFGSDLDAALWDAGLVGDVWKVWAAINPWIADALAEDPVLDDEWRPPLLRTSILASLPARGLLELEPAGDWRRVGMALGHHPEDVELILAAAHDPDHAMRPAAIHALGMLGRPELLALARSLTETDPPRPLGVAIAGALNALPFAISRDLALDWLGTPDLRRRAAARVLAAHATAADVDAARAALTAETPLGDQYVICSLAEALGRVPAAGPTPALRDAYEEMPYSYGRHFVVAAIAATDPSFATTLAPECRHDCEATTRELASA